MVEKEECCFVEFVSRVDEDVASSPPFKYNFHHLLNVENVHL
jgi:hypothetical protein